MKSVSSLGNLLNIETPSEIKNAQSELTEDCKNTVKKIRELIQDHVKNFEERISDRMNAIKTEYNAVLPSISNEDHIAVQDIIQHGISQAPKQEVAKGVKFTDNYYY